MEVTCLDDKCHISGRWLLDIWTMIVTYLDECYISRPWRLHIWTSVTYLDDGGYISRRVLHIWTMEGTCLDDWGCILGRCRLHVWTCVTHLDDGGYMSERLWLHIWTVIYLHVTRGLDNIRHGINCVKQVNSCFPCGKKYSFIWVLNVHVTPKQCNVMSFLKIIDIIPYDT